MNPRADYIENLDAVFEAIDEIDGYRDDERMRLRELATVLYNTGMSISDMARLGVHIRRAKSLKKKLDPVPEEDVE